MDTKEPDAGTTEALARTVLDIVGALPPSRLRRRADPAAASAALVREAAAKTALAAGALALPLGPLGWLTVLPELATVWRLQARLVADIAAVHGRPPPGPEALLYCLFAHSSGRVVRELLLQVGERSLVRTLTAPLLALLVRRVGASLARRLAGRSLARWLPLAGAAGLAAWAAWETRQVGHSALALMAQDALAPPAAG